MAGKFKFIALGVIVIGLAMGVAFGLGVAYGKGDDTAAATSGITLAQIQQMVGGSAPSGAGGAGAAGSGSNAGASSTPASGAASAVSARSTAGRITAVQGQTVTIEIRAGLTQKLNLAAASVVNKFQVGAPADLKEGSSVMVTGTRKDDGSFDVATINIVAPELVQALAAGATTTGTSPAGATPAAPAAPAATPTR